MMKADHIEKMFDRISFRYDLSNTLMTMGMDWLWRKGLLEKAKIEPHMRVLDVGTGTAKLLKRAQRFTLDLFGLDLSARMLDIAKASVQGAHFVRGDAVFLPFKDESFDRVISAFLLRNVTDLLGSLKEQVRVLKRKGIWCALETMPISPINPLGPLLRFYFRKIVPFVGGLVTKNKRAYEYLYKSTFCFRPPEEIKILLLRAGLRKVRYKTFAFGSTVLYYGIKP